MKDQEEFKIHTVVAAKEGEQLYSSCFDGRIFYHGDQGALIIYEAIDKEDFNRKMIDAHNIMVDLLR